MPGFVDQDGIDFVDNGEIEIALDVIFQAELHVVAEIIEPELVVGSVGDIGVVGGVALGIVEIVEDGADVQAEEAVHAAHPLGVATREIVVHRHDMNALALQRIEITRESCDQRLTFSGLHFSDASRDEAQRRPQAARRSGACRAPGGPPRAPRRRLL